MLKMASSPVTSEAVGSISAQTYSLCDSEDDSLWQVGSSGVPVSSYI
jgi:hypothetical protein